MVRATMKTYKQLRTEIIYKRYKSCKYNVVKTAKSLQLNRDTVRKFIKDHPDYKNKLRKQELKKLLEESEKIIPEYVLLRKFRDLSVRFIKQTRLQYKQRK